MHTILGGVMMNKTEKELLCKQPDEEILIEALKIIINYIKDEKNKVPENANKSLPRINKINDFTDKHLLDVEDIKELFQVGTSKASHIMHIVPHFRVGKKDMCTRIDLYETTMKNKLKIKW